MKTENIQLMKLTADNGMVLTNGESYGREIYLGANDKADLWREVPESAVHSDTGTEDEPGDDGTGHE